MSSEITPDFRYLFSSFTNQKQSGFTHAILHDSLAALIGAILVIPQGIAFSYLVGIPVEYGLSCGVVVTLFAALFGRSIAMSGPNTATSILLGVTVLPFVAEGVASPIELVLQISLLVGLLQLLVWLFRLAKVAELLDAVTVSSITNAVGVLIILASLTSFFAIEGVRGSFAEKINWIFIEKIDHWNFYSALVGIGTAGVGLFMSRKFPKLYIYFAVVSGFFVAGVIGLINPKIELVFLKSVGTEFLAFDSAFLNSFDGRRFLLLLPSAISVAVISLAHTVVIAKDLKLNVDDQVSINRETFAIGIANLVAPFFQAFAGAGSFNRTQVNRELVVKSSSVAVLTAIFSCLLVLLLGQMFRFIPDAVIGGLLFIVGWRMIRFDKIRSFMSAPIYRYIFILNFFVVLAFGLVAGVATAIVLSVLKRFLWSANSIAESQNK